MGLIAVDWGTTNCRAYSLDGEGCVLRQTSTGMGISSVPQGGFPDALAGLLRALGAEGRVLIAGMAGSNRGWIEVPYVAAPADAATIAARCDAVPGFDNVRIVPGVRLIKPHRADVMRGEETQILGTGLIDGAICLPGTHTKWAKVERGEIVSFFTAMAGEVYHLLRTQSILRASMPDDGGAIDNDGFLAGLAAAKKGRLLHDAFALRPMSLLEGREPAWCEGYLSGLVIGTDVREGAPERGQRVTVVGADRLARLYADALRSAALIPQIVDGAAAFARGAWRIAASVNWEN